MAINIPETVFSKYEEFADAMIADFGVSCTLIYTDEVESISDSVPQVKQRRSMNIQDRNDPAAFARGTSTFRTVESTESITLRVYRTPKDFIKVSNMVVPDGAIQTIGYLSDLTKINKAKAAIMDAGLAGHEEYRYVKTGEPAPFGFKHRRYIVCYWKRE
jgi:hypothetical protein